MCPIFQSQVYYLKSLPTLAYPQILAVEELLETAEAVPPQEEPSAPTAPPTPARRYGNLPILDHKMWDACISIFRFGNRTCFCLAVNLESLEKDMFLFGIQVWAGSCVCCQLFLGPVFSCRQHMGGIFGEKINQYLVRK